MMRKTAFLLAATWSLFWPIIVLTASDTAVTGHAKAIALETQQASASNQEEEICSGRSQEPGPLEELQHRVRNGDPVAHQTLEV